MYVHTCIYIYTHTYILYIIYMYYIYNIHIYILYIGTNGASRSKLQIRGRISGRRMSCGKWRTSSGRFVIEYKQEFEQTIKKMKQKKPKQGKLAPEQHFQAGVRQMKPKKKSDQKQL
jgi:hypothetical protein